MRNNVKEFIKICAETLPISEPIYEFGSLQVDNQNSDLRPFFKGKQYVGVDYREGKGVDVVADIMNLKEIKNKSVGTIICCETLEHVKAPFKAVAEFGRILKDDGILIITTPFYFKIHSYPNDYWRFTEQGMYQLIKDNFLNHYIYIDKIGHKDKPHSIYAISTPILNTLKIHPFIFESLDKHKRKYRRQFIPKERILNLYVRVKRYFFGKNFKILK